MKQITVDSSLNKLSIEALTVQIGYSELMLVSFFKFLWRTFRRAWLCNGSALQVPLDRARGELLSDAETLIIHWEIFRGKIRDERGTRSGRCTPTFRLGGG